MPQRCLKSESSWIWRTLTKHAPACTDRTSRPLPWSTEIGPKARSIKNTPKLHRPRSRRALLVPRRASGVLQRACEEAEWAPEAPPEEYSGTLAVSKCARTHTLDGIPAQREVRSEAPYCVPKGAQRGPGATKGTQESSKRGLKGCLAPPRRSIVAPWSPKTVSKSRSFGSPRACEKWPCPQNGGNSILTIICYTSGTSPPRKSTILDHFGVPKSMQKQGLETNAPKSYTKEVPKGAKRVPWEPQGSSARTREGS